jgi:3-methyladenine DNA glycosylase AlkD
MKKSQVLAALKEQQDERGIAHWKKMGAKNHGLRSFGLGLTKLRKIAKQIGRDHLLAQELWRSNVYDAKVLGLLIGDPKLLTRAEAEMQVEQLMDGMFAHVFAACDATLAKSPFAFDLAKEWTRHKDSMRRRCGYSLIYELSKKKRVPGMDDPFLIACIGHILATFDDEEMWVRCTMGGALMGIGKRSKKLNKIALRAAKKIGPIEFESGSDRKCEPFDVAKHLTSDYLKQKLKIS